MYKYWGFGLSVVSDIEFPELLPATHLRADVTISTGTIPSIQATASFCTGRISYMLNDHELVFTVRDLASYYVADGNRIIVSPHTAHIEQRVIRLFILAGAMAGILQQRGLVPLHAAAVTVNSQLVLIAGRSGAGKSTTLAGLKGKGYKIFSDDITVLQQLPDDDQIRGIASYPMLKLWEDSLQVLALHDRTFPVMPGMEKYGVFFHNGFDTQHYPIGRIILLEMGKTDTIQCRQLKGSEAFTQVVQQIYKPVLFNQPGSRAVCFDVISNMVRQSEVHRVSRPARCAPDTLLNTVTSLI